jgi:hypothetical protein
MSLKSSNNLVALGYSPASSFFRIVDMSIGFLIIL